MKPSNFLCVPRVVVLLAATTGAAGRASAADAQETTPPIAATVNGTPIFVAELDAVIKGVKQLRGGSATESAEFQAEMLRQLVQRRLVVQLLEREGGYFTEEEIEKAFETVKAEAVKKDTSLEKLAAGLGVSVKAWRDELIWQLGWNRYVERNLTDELQNYFEAHRKDFDGTQVRASHILLRPQRAGQSNSQRIPRAKQIRDAIEAGKLTFEEAAARFSDGPSGVKGGDLGHFPRHGVMVEDFSKEAFKLEKGQISEPVVTPFGLHLILVTDITPGRKQWTEVLDQLRGPASLEMVESLANKEAETAKIEFTGTVPYVDPETDKLVLPAAGAN